jgi:hypothetical protein
LVPPLGVVFELLRVADRATLRGNPGASDFLRDEFGFWQSGLAAHVRLQLLAHLVLTIAAIVAAVVATRVAVLVVAIAQALVALPGVIWDYTSLHHAPPSWLLDAPIPVPGGRWTSITYLAVAIAAIVLVTTRTLPSRR